MALSPYSGPRIRARFNTRIPARVNSGPGISQVIANGALTTGLDLESLDPVVSIPDPSLYRLFVYNEATETWETTTLDNLPTTTTGDAYTGRGDANYTFLSTDRYVELTTALTAARIWTLPVASTYPAGTRIVVQDAIGGITSTNTLTIQANAADTINGAATFVLNAAYAGVELRSNGVNKWSARVINDGSVGTSKLADGAATNSKLANMAQATFKMRAAGAGTGAPIDGTAAQAKTALGLGTMADQAASSVVVTGGTLDGVVIGGTNAAALAATTITANSIATAATSNSTSTQIAARNQSAGASASTRLQLGNDADAADFTITLNGSANTGGLGARTVSIVSNGGALQIVNSGIFYAPAVYNQTTATPANVAVDTGGQVRRSTSSLRYKTDVHDYARGLSDLLRLRPVTYSAKSGEPGRFVGFIAEEVHAAGLTEFVAYDAEGKPDALHYPSMVALVAAALKEAAAAIDALKADVATLKGRP